MASNKHVNLKKNFVRSICYPEDITKDKGKLILENFLKTLKSLMDIIPYSFLLQESLGGTWFAKKYLFTRKKRLPGVFISSEMTGEYIFPCK